MLIHNKIKEEIVKILEEMKGENLPAEVDFSPVTVEPPRDPSHGDLATNAALVLAKKAGVNPRDLAEEIVVGLNALALVDECSVAGPGFINLRLAAGIWHSVVGDILKTGLSFGDSQMGAGQKVNIEYVSANPTGPMHVGHVRGAVIGDALANLLQKAGFDVTKEYYINDAGSQIDTLARSAYLRYLEVLGEDIGEIPEGLYPGKYLKPVGQLIFEKYGDSLKDKPEEEWLDDVKALAADAMMDVIREDLKVLGVEHDVFFSERALHASGRIDEMISDLEKADLVYEGVLEPPKGKTPDDWEPRPQTLFRSTMYGDDVDRPLKKSDGSYTYFAADIAYHYDKFKRGFLHQIDVLGADHGGYVKRIQAAVKAASGGKASLDVRLCQLVRLFRGGQPVKMSKRSGSFITLRELVDEVGRGVVRFIMLTRRSDAPLDFDFAKVLEQSKDNPVFYVQYAHARAHSAFRRAGEELPKLDTSDAALKGANLNLLEDEAELDLIKILANWPRMVEQAAEAHEPHRIAFYLYDLASAFHSLWNRGNDDPDCRFIRADAPEITLSRLALVKATQIVIASGLKIVGVEPVKEMR